MLLLPAIVLNAQKNTTSTGKGLAISIGYSKQDQRELNSYLKVLSDSFSLISPLTAPDGINFELEYRSRVNKTEFIAGGGIFSSASVKKANDGSSVKVKTNQTGIYFGVNFFPVKNIFIGSTLGAFDNTGKLTFDNLSATNTGVLTRLISTTDDEGLKNVFSGYVVNLKLQAGLRFPFGKNRKNDFRFTPYYNKSFTKYNVLNGFDKQMTSYTGATKTGVTSYGVNVSMMFGI